LETIWYSIGGAFNILRVNKQPKKYLPQQNYESLRPMLSQFCSISVRLGGAQKICLQTFINRCIRRIYKIFWPETISNKYFWQMATEKPIIL
jgi:hypothetical protein